MPEIPILPGHAHLKLSRKATLWGLGIIGVGGILGYGFSHAADRASGVRVNAPSSAYASTVDLGYRTGTENGYKSWIEDNLVFPKEPMLLSKGGNRWQTATTPSITATASNDIVSFQTHGLDCKANTRTAQITCRPTSR